MKVGEIKIRPSGPLVGTLRVPPDKSITHRAFLLSSLATTPSEISNPLLGDDCIATLNICRKLGTTAVQEGDVWRINPATDWSLDLGELDCGNSGTTLRLMSGVLASKGVNAVLSGDESLSKRPMKRVVTPLQMMGASIQGEFPPVQISSSMLHGIDYVSSIPSAQVKSAVLLAGLSAEGSTSVRESMQSRDHTERMLSGFGADIQVTELTTIVRPSKFAGFRIDVPGDISSAAFWMVAAAIVPGSELTLLKVGVNPTRAGILDVLSQAGADFELENAKDGQGEPVSDIVIRFKPGLKNFKIEGALVPRLIDEIPVLALFATQCQGISKFHDVEELTVKESNRLERTVELIRALGGKAEITAEGFEIEGPTPLVGATMHAHHDHRMAMTLAIAGLIAPGETIILGAETIGTSYPDFMQQMSSLQQ